MTEEEERVARAQGGALDTPLIMGHQDGGFGGHPLVGAEGQVCEEATKDLPNVWKLWNVQNFVWMKVRVFCAHLLSNLI